MIGNIMKFNSIEELTTWLTERDMSISELVVSEGVINLNSHARVITSVHEGDLMDTPSTVNATVIESQDMPRKDVKIKSLSVPPTIKYVPITESSDRPNIWYVDSYESIDDECCGTSRIVYKGNTILMNVCESKGDSTVALVTEVDGVITRIPFKLDSNCNSSEEYDMIIYI